MIVFENGSSAAQSVDEATVKGQKTNSRSADLTLLSPGSFSLVFGPRSIPRALPLLIPLAYSVLDTYLKGPSVVEDIAQLLERMAVSSEVLRGPEIIQSNSEKTADQLLPGSLKRSPSYDPRYGDKTRAELDKLARQGDNRAGKMKKLVDQVERLLDKNKEKK